MAFQSVPNTAIAVCHGVMNGQQIANTFYGEFPSGYVESDLQEFADVVDSVWGGVITPLLNAAYEYTGTEVRGLEDAIDLSATADAEAGVGGASGTVLSNNAALSVKRRSNQTGRGARGRIYIPGISTGSLESQNTVSTAFADAIEAGLNGMNDLMDAAGIVPVIVHRTAAGVPLTVAVLFTIVEWVVVDRVIDSMRRRLPGRGA